MVEEVGIPRSYPTAEQAQLGERVTNLGRRQTDFEGEVRAGFSQINTSIKLLSDELRGSSKTQWPVIWSAIGVSFAILLAVGSQALGPIRDAQVDLKQSILVLATATNHSIEMLADKSVTREEINWRSERGAEDRKRTDDDISDLRSTMVSRNEWQERNASRDHEIVAIHEAEARDIANVQRQIDQVRTDFTAFASSLGNGRDSFADMKSEIRRLEERLDAWRIRRTRTDPAN